METMTKPSHNIEAITDALECIYTLADIEKGLDRMATAITQKVKDARPIFICVMTGALIPMGHLLTRLSFPLEIDYIHATRYRGTTRGGDLHWLVEPRRELKDRTVVIVDDIMDGGLTLMAIIDYCKQAGAEAVYTAVMIDKQRQREPGVDFEPDFSGLKTEDRFLVGFGLDYDEYLRNLPGIYAVAEEHQ
jgi:hypoxanthine phosphoribosyltransferase